MDQGLLPRRYAKALYKYAVERDVAAQMYTVMDTLTKAYDDNASLQATIANPFVDTPAKPRYWPQQQKPKAKAKQQKHLMILSISSDDTAAWTSCARRHSHIWPYTAANTTSTRYTLPPQLHWPTATATA